MSNLYCPSGGWLMANGGGPKRLHGPDLRYQRAGKAWRVDNASAQRKILWLTWGAAFIGMFGGVLLLGFLANPGEDMSFTIEMAGWLLLIIILFGTAAVLAIKAWRIKNSPPAGAYFKAYAMRPASLDNMLHRAVASVGEGLQPLTVDNTRWVNQRFWDCHRSYVLEGRGSHINIIRKFKLSFTSVEVSSFLEMGPKGKGEDELLDRLAAAVDTENIYGPEDQRVSFAGMEDKYRTRMGLRNICRIVGLGAILFYFAYFFDLIPNEGASSYLSQYPLVFLTLIVTAGLAVWSERDLLRLARKATDA